MFLLDDECAKIILFFHGDKIVKEMHFVEFEAILDGYAPDIDWADRDVSACYLEVNSQLQVSAVVFFCVAFDSHGWVDSAWNIPLIDLARTSVKGPDLGAGPIRIATQSSCPIQLFNDMLWEPPKVKLNAILQDIKKVVAKNRLEIRFGQAANDYGQELTVGAARHQEELHQSKQTERQLKDQLAQLIKEQRVQTAALNNERVVALRKLKVEQAKRLESLTRELNETQNSLAQAVNQNHRLRESTKNTEQKLKQLRDYFQLKLENARTSDADTLASMKKHYEQEADARISAVEAEYKELLKLKEIELAYRSEREMQMQADLARLREQNQELMASSGDKLLKSLSLKGVNFVTYQPGAGHITIPIAEMSKFVDSPAAFTAAYCEVSEKHYEAWLNHFHAPVCDGKLESGERCCDDLPRVSKPIDFVAGESNLCEHHRSVIRREKFTVVKAS